MKEKEFKRLVEKYHRKCLSDQEKKQLNAFEKELLKRHADSAFKSKLHQEQVRQRMLASLTQKEPKENWKRLIAVVASFALLVSLGLGFFTNDNKLVSLSPSTISISNPNSEPKKVLLEDGTTVTLNHHSQITYMEAFEGDSRQVELEGEAFFEVARDIDKPFIVLTDAIRVQVLGTEFNVFQGDAAIEVTVSSGAVQVYDEDEFINLLPDQQVQFDRGSGQMQKRAIKHQLIGLWKQESVNLKDISMAEFATALFQTHGISMEFESEHLAALKLAISYHKREPIEEIIKRVNYINPVKLIKINDNVKVIKS